MRLLFFLLLFVFFCPLLLLLVCETKEREVRRHGTEDKVLQVTETIRYRKKHTDGLKTTACGGGGFTNLDLWYLNSVTTRHFNCFKDMK